MGRGGGREMGRGGGREMGRGGPEDPGKDVLQPGVPRHHRLLCVPAQVHLQAAGRGPEPPLLPRGADQCGHAGAEPV